MAATTCPQNRPDRPTRPQTPWKFEKLRPNNPAANYSSSPITPSQPTAIALAIFPLEPTKMRHATTVCSVCSATLIAWASSYGASTNSEKCGSYKSGSAEMHDSSSTAELSSITFNRPTLADCAPGNCERGLRKTSRRTSSGRRSDLPTEAGDGDLRNEVDGTTSGRGPLIRRLRNDQERSHFHKRGDSRLKLFERLRERRQRQPVQHGPATEQTSLTV